MDRSINSYIDVMKALGIGTQKKFECWYEKYLQGRENMNFNMDGFTWDDAQIGFDYEFAEVTDTVTAMATYLDIYSQAVARGREIPLRTIAGYIPRQKRYETKDENDYRTEAIQAQKLAGVAELRGESPYADIKDYFSKNLLEFAGDFPASHAQSITYQVGQMKSNFSLDLTDANNPNGIVGVSFKAKVSEDNTILGEYYTVDADGAVIYDEDKHPIQDYNKFLNKLLFDGTYGAVEVEADEWSFLTFMGHPDIVRAIGYLEIKGLFISAKTNAEADARASEAGAHIVSVDGNDTAIMISFFKRIFKKISEVKLHNEMVAVATLNEETKKFEYPLLRAFNEHVMLFRPTGNIGTIKNVTPMRPDSSYLYSWMFDKRGIMDYWYDPRTKTQHWESELTVLAVPNRPKKLHRIVIGKSTAATGVSMQDSPAAKTNKKSTSVIID